MKLNIPPRSRIKSRTPNPEPRIQRSASRSSTLHWGALASMTEEDFRRAFSHSPIKRAKYRGWLRNLCVAMGNSGDPSFIPWLEQAAEHHDELCEHAGWALKQLRER